MNQLYMFVYVYVKIAILSPLVQSSKETQLKESLITFCLLVRYPSTRVLSCRRPSRCTRNGRCLCLRTSNAPNLGSRCVMREKRFHSSCHLPVTCEIRKEKNIHTLSNIQISFRFCRVWYDTITMRTFLLRTRYSPARHKAN